MEASPPAPRRSTLPGVVLGLGLGGFADGIRDLPVHVPAYDWVFLAVGGVGLVVLGGLLSRREPRPAPPPR